MAVAFDAVTPGTGPSVTHTASGTQRFAVAIVTTKSDNLTGVTYGGLAMTFQVKRINAGINGIALYTLANPPLGERAVTASPGGALSVATYTGVDQAAPVEASAQNNGYGMVNPVVTLTAAEVGAALVHGVNFRITGEQSTSDTVRVNHAASGQTGLADRFDIPTGTVTGNWSRSTGGNDNWVTAGLLLRAATGESTPEPAYAPAVIVGGVEVPASWSAVVGGVEVPVASWARVIGGAESPLT